MSRHASASRFGNCQDEVLRIMVIPYYHVGTDQTLRKAASKSRMKMSGGTMTGSAPRRGYLLATTAIMTFLTAPAAWAQADQTVAVAGQPEQVVVTGSLLSNPNFTAPTP